MVKLHLGETDFQMVFESVEAIEDAVMEGFLTAPDRPVTIRLTLRHGTEWVILL
jgi:hypothetical protein